MKTSNFVLKLARIVRSNSPDSKTKYCQECGIQTDWIKEKHLTIGVYASHNYSIQWNSQKIHP